MTRYLKILLLPFCLLVVIIMAAVTYYLHCFEVSPISSQFDGQLFTVDKGMTRYELARRMHAEQLLQKSWLLPIYMRFHPELSSIKAGTYHLTMTMNVKRFLLLLNSGKEAQLTLQFVEGINAADWMKKLQAAPMLKRELNDTDSFIDIARKIGAESNTIEGWFYPDTYHYAPNTTDIELLKRAYIQMHKKLHAVWHNRDDQLPYQTPYELLIMASLIEKETGKESERRLVASVFINRLNRQMKLQTDPTVIYGLGAQYTGVIRRSDLQNKNPYNTYIINGLPPTPIAMPSSASLDAAAHPAKTDYLYFVADGQNGHYFSSDLSSHNKAVSRYLRIGQNYFKK